MTRRQEYIAAVQSADTKRESFLANAQIARNRISPSRLKSDVKSKVHDAVESGRQKGKDVLHTHPVAVGVIGAGVVAYLFRRPLCRLVKRVSSRSTEPDPVGWRHDLRGRFEEFRKRLSKSITEIRNEK